MQVEKIKFLVITIDKNWSLKQHLSQLCLKISRIIPLLLKVKHFATIEILMCLYYVHIYPHLIYCNPIWSQTYPCPLYQLNVLHKKVIKIITNSVFNEHTPPLFRSLNILNLADLSKLNTASYMLKMINTNVYNTQPTHNYQTRNQDSLNIPTHKLTLFKHSLMYSGPNISNVLQMHMKQSTSLSSFRNKFKNKLLSSY